MSDIKVKTALANAEDFLKQAALNTGEKAAELREKGLHALKQAKDIAHNLQEVVSEKSKYVARTTDDYVHEHPWRSIGLGVGVGLLLGLIINRK